MHPDQLPPDPQPDEEPNAAPASDDETTDQQPDAPRIVSETPIGGKTPRIVPAAQKPVRPTSDSDDQPDSDDPAPATDPALGEDVPPSPAENDRPAAPEHDPDAAPDAAQPADLPDPSALRGAEQPTGDFSPAPPQDAGHPPASVEVTPAPEADAAPDEAAISPASAPDIAPPETTSETPPRAARPQPAPEADAPGEMAAAEEWDDDLSPELAAVLFDGKRGAPSRQPEPAPPTPASDEAPMPDDGAPPALPEAEPVPAAEPIELTDIAQAETLPITAQDTAAPPPTAPLAGRQRYVRLEEPVDNDGGLHVKETWDYLEPDRPALDGRAVKQVRAERFDYPDGSWKWTFRRQYVDRGYDAREVRANADRTYIERDDAIKRRDVDDQTVERSEKAALILSAPVQEEKRGFLSALLGRESETEGPATWHEASPAESRVARKDGGEAFDRGLLSGLF